jgi:hypothetical protein
MEEQKELRLKVDVNNDLTLMMNEVSLYLASILLELRAISRGLPDTPARMQSEIESECLNVFLRMRSLARSLLPAGHPDKEEKAP